MENKIRIILIILICILGLLVIALLYELWKKNKNETSNKKIQKKDKKIDNTSTEKIEKVSVMDFMEFDKIEDNMIIQKNGKKYIMAIECQGINYDLMSRVEKDAVETGFIQFLNTLRFQIQLYIQTRTVDLEKSILVYRDKIKKMQNDYEEKLMEYNQMKVSGSYTQAQKDKAFYEMTRKKNLYEYGKDVILNTESMSLNSDVLKKKYYIIISYFSEDVQGDNLDKDEIKGTAFQELFTRASALISSIAVCGVKGKILDSYGLADLLYNAYNREDAETYGINKAIQAGYSELYTTAPDVMERKIKELDKIIENKAIDIAANEVNKVRYAKQEEYENKKRHEDDLALEMAISILTENMDLAGEEITEEAKANLNKKRVRKE